MCAPAAVQNCGPSRAIAACSAPMARCPVPRSRGSVRAKLARPRAVQVSMTSPRSNPEKTMMAACGVPSLEAYWHDLQRRLPHFLPEEQPVAVALYRELAKGRAVDAAQLGRALGISPAEGHALLRRDCINDLVYSDDQGRVIGFGGLAATPMHHRFEVDGRILSTWCAWDSLFIPGILQRPARVLSADPESGALVRLIVTPNRIESADPADDVVSFVRPEASAFEASPGNLMAKFGPFIFCFESAWSYERGARKHPGTFPLSLDQAVALGQRLNASTFGSG